MILQFIKDYGSVISPTIAFILGIIAILIKYVLDNRLQKRQTMKSFKKAKEMLSKIQLPEYRKGPETTDCLMHATMARNLTGISRMYFSLTATYQYFKSLDVYINRSNNLLIINQYFYLVWRIEKLIKNLEDIRKQSDIEESTWRGLQHEIPELLEFIENDWFALNDSIHKHYSI